MDCTIRNPHTRRAYARACARIIDLRLDLHGAAGSRVPQGRAGQMARGDFDRDDRATATKWVKGHLAALDDGSIDRVGHRSEMQLVPETIDATQLTIGVERQAVERLGRGRATGAPPRLFRGQTISAL